VTDIYGECKLHGHTEISQIIFWLTVGRFEAMAIHITGKGELFCINEAAAAAATE